MTHWFILMYSPVSRLSGGEHMPELHWASYSLMPMFKAVRVIQTCDYWADEPGCSCARWTLHNYTVRESPWRTTITTCTVVHFLYHYCIISACSHVYGHICFLLMDLDIYLVNLILSHAYMPLELYYDNTCVIIQQPVPLIMQTNPHTHKQSAIMPKGNVRTQCVPGVNVCSCICTEIHWGGGGGLGGVRLLSKPSLDKYSNTHRHTVSHYALNGRLWLYFPAFAMNQSMSAEDNRPLILALLCLYRGHGNCFIFGWVD